MHRSSVKVTGVLLVGGLSRRMGQDKATLVVDDQPLWARQLSVLRRLNLEAIFISARVTPVWAPADTQLLLDVPPSRGPLSGIALALHVMTSSHLLVIAVDLPQLTFEYLRKLIALCKNAKGVVPSIEGRVEPLTAVYPKEAAGVALNCLAGKDVSMQSFVRQLTRHDMIMEYQVAPEERIEHRNLNTREELVKPSKQQPKPKQ